MARLGRQLTHVSQGGLVVVQERDLVSMPLRLQTDRPASLTKLQVLKRFEFESRLMRSGVVAVDSQGPPNTALLFVRGAPAKIEQLVKGGVLPPDYHQVGCSVHYSHAWVLNLYNSFHAFITHLFFPGVRHVQSCMFNPYKQGMCMQL